MNPKKFSLMVALLCMILANLSCLVIDIPLEVLRGIIPQLEDEEGVDLPPEQPPDEPPPTAAEPTRPFIAEINPCEGIYKKYAHDPALGEIKAEYIGSWHAGESVSAGFNERFIFFPTGNYLFFPSQYECTYSSDESCVPSPIEDGLWGVQGQVMYLAKGGDINNITHRSVTEVIPSSPDESPYPFKTTIDGLPFWLISPDTNLWDPETGEYCN